MCSQVMTVPAESGNSFFKPGVPVEIPGKEERRFYFLLLQQVGNKIPSFCKFMTCKN